MIGPCNCLGLKKTGTNTQGGKVCKANKAYKAWCEAWGAGKIDEKQEGWRSREKRIRRKKKTGKDGKEKLKG